MRSIVIMTAVCLLAACGEKQETAVAPRTDQQMANTQGVAVQAGRDAIVTVNYQKSQDWQKFLADQKNLREKISKHPDDADYRTELAELEQQMEGFKRDVLKLAEDINKIPLNTERLKLAVKHFNAGEYAKARAVLDVPELAQEQDSLLARQQQLNVQQAELQASLNDKANEYLLLAKLRAIDYSLGEQRIAKTLEAFEQALKSGRTQERLFKYAKFLQDNNQFKPAEEIYSEALDNYRKLAADNPSAYLPDLATTLNNLGILVAADSNRHQAAETLFTESLEIRRKLAADNPSVYLPHVATTLNNLGNLVKIDSKRRQEAETLYTEALAIRRKLAADNPSVYLPDVAGTLNNLGILVKADSNRRQKAETLYTEALAIRRKLAADNPSVYLPDVAGTLNNLGILVAADSNRRQEAETLYTEALGNYRKLAADNPSVYLPNVAMTLNNLGLLVSDDSNRRQEAETLYTEALGNYRKLAADNPSVYLPDVAKTLLGFGLAHLQWGEPAKARVYLHEAADIIKPFAAQHPNVYGGLQDGITEWLAEANSVAQ
jgi:hypothetical protein